MSMVCLPITYSFVMFWQRNYLTAVVVLQFNFVLFLFVLKNAWLLCFHECNIWPLCLCVLFDCCVFRNVLFDDCHFRGMGMMVGVELVMDKQSRKPAKEAAEILGYKSVSFLWLPCVLSCDYAYCFHTCIPPTRADCSSHTLLCFPPPPFQF